MSFSIKERQASIDVVKNKKMDVLIIGGGITGAGVAIQTAASGMSTALVEMQDFAEGTSSRSTKLVHGGIRYLKNFDVEVVSDTVKERATVQRIAPHIPKPDPMLLPIYDEPGSTFSMFSVKVAMDLYDQLAKVTDTSFANKVLSKEEVIERVPKINTDKLLGGGLYLDFRNNDARLVIENIKQAVTDGAHALSKTKVIGFIYHENGQISGVTVEDQLTKEVYNIEVEDNHNYFVNGILTHNCQNLSTDLFKTIISRLGNNSKMIFLGDIEQIDLKDKKTSCLKKICEIFKDDENVKIVELTDEDCVRNKKIPAILQVLRNNNL